MLTHIISRQDSLEMLRRAIGSKKTPAMKPLKAPTCIAVKASKDFLIKIKEEPQVMDKMAKRNHLLLNN